MRFLPVALLLTVVSACSTPPPRVPPSPTATPIPVAPAQPQARTATNTRAALPIDPDLVKRGYHPAIRRGQRVYCREEPVTGSRFTQTRCMTADQISDSATSTKDYLNAPRPDGTCATIKCN